jgi:hypothetical protein
LAKDRGWLDGNSSSGTVTSVLALEDLLTILQPEFVRVVAEHGVDLISEDRGSPENKGLNFKAQQ